MSVYSRTTAAGKTVWRYDFTWGGERHLSADPHYQSEAKARGAERALKKQLKRGHSPKSASVSGMIQNAVTMETAKGIITLEQACDRFWKDKGRHHRSAADIKRRLEHVKRIVGADEKVASGGVAAIKTATVIAAVQTRRAEETLTRYGKPSGKQVTESCANRDIIDQLRPVMNYAAEVFEDDGLVVRTIKWKSARLKEADEIVCEFTDDEIRRWGEELNAAAERHGRDGATERAFLTLALEYGPRLGELHFPPASFKPDAPGGAELDLGRYTGKGGVTRESRKDRSLHTIPLLDDTVAMLQPFVDRARAAGAATIWLEDIDGRPTSISYDAMRYRLKAAAEKAGIAKARIIHGMRHHAGTTMNREGGLGRVQQLLGHKQITTSRRYAHTTKADLKGDLARIRDKKSRPSPAQAPPSGSGRSL